MRLAFRCALVASLLWSACGDDDGGGGEVLSVTQLIGPEGGEVELVGGGRVTFPPGAVTTQTEIKITKLELGEIAPLPSHMEPAGKPFAFEPHGFAFAQPIKISVPYEGDPTEVRPMKLDDEQATTWHTVVGSEKDDVTKQLSYDATTFSVILAARPRRNSGVITLPDGATIPEDAGTAGTGGSAGVGGNAGVGGLGGSGGDAAVEMDAAVDATIEVDASMDAAIEMDATVMTTLTVEPPPYSGRTAFLSFVFNDGADVWSATGADCLAAGMTSVDSCIQVGLLRRTVVDELSACSQVTTIEDSANAFDWECVDSSGSVVVRTTGMRDEAGLRDLIDFTAIAWRPMSVSVRTNTGVTYASPPAVWWTEVVRNPEVSGQPLPVNVVGIWAIPSNAIGGVWVSGDHVGVVTAPGVTITATSTQVGQDAFKMLADHGWLEVSGANNSVAVDTSTGSVVRHSSGPGLNLTSSHHVRVHGMQGGLSLVNSTHNVAEHITGRVNVSTGASDNVVRDVVAQVASTCVSFTDTAMRNLVDGVMCEWSSGDAVNLFNEDNTLANLIASTTNTQPDSMVGVRIAGSRNRVLNSVISRAGTGIQTVTDLGGGASVNEGGHTIQGVRVTNSLYTGIRINTPNTRVVDAIVVGSGNNAIWNNSESTVILNATLAMNGSGLVANHFNTVANVAGIANAQTVINLNGMDLNVGNLLAAHTGTFGIGAGSTATAQPQGEFVVGSNSNASCTADVGSDVGFGSDCLSTLPSLSIVIDADLTGQLRAEQGDSVNTADTATGHAILAAITGAQWGAFEHRYRIWGPAGADGESFPDPSVYGPCSSARCQIYDFTPSTSASNSYLLNRFPVPTVDGVITHRWSANTEAECDAVEPNAWNGEFCASQFHLLGVETDAVPGQTGDGDGLCEADEPCVRTRNHGAYQGHGTLTPTTGNFDFGPNGTFRFYDHSNNGR